MVVGAVVLIREGGGERASYRKRERGEGEREREEGTF